jgi:lipoprotein-releasing system ATP-binding protein
MNNDNTLTVEGVKKSYDSSRSVLDGVSMTARPSDTVSIVGPSGCGKSTLLNIIGALDKPDSGSISLGSLDVAALKGTELAKYRSGSVGFIFQDHHLLPQLTAVENVLLPSVAAKRAAVRDDAIRMLDRVGVAGQADAFPSRMSGGERQRVAVARALINTPSLLLCDEPTGNLDQDSGKKVIDLLIELAAEQHVTVVMVTHNRDFAARFGRCVALRDGRLFEKGRSD